MGTPGCDVGRDLLQAGLSDEATAVVAAGIGVIRQGRALSPSEIWPQDPAFAAEVVGALFEAGRAEVDEQGRVVGLHGFTLEHTRHCFRHGGVQHNTWCAFDSVGIPAAFGWDATAVTDCPTCGRELTVTIRAGVPEPGTAAEADFAQWLPTSAGTGDLRGQFCANADIYCCRAHLEERIDTAAAAGTVLTVAEAAEVGREVWADVALIAEAPYR